MFFHDDILTRLQQQNSQDSWRWQLLHHAVIARVKDVLDTVGIGRNNLTHIVKESRLIAPTIER